MITWILTQRRVWTSSIADVATLSGWNIYASHLLLRRPRRRLRTAKRTISSIWFDLIMTQSLKPSAMQLAAAYSNERVIYFSLSQERDRVIYGGKKWVLRAERKTINEEAMRRERGRSFQIVGAAKENERWPAAESIWDTVRNCWLVDLRLREGL